MQKIDGGITAPKGFSVSSCAAGIKYKDREDMVLISSDALCTCGGVFTSNVVKAAPVIWDRDIVAEGKGVRAVVVNSGIANACTGQEGLDICAETAAEAAKALGVLDKEVLVGSTGVIGMQLPMDRIKAGIGVMSGTLDNSRESAGKAVRAMMTTDTVPKESAYTFDLYGTTATVAGMCKGSGMIHPNMCTMLAYMTTDAAVEKELLQKAVREIADESFNMISVDGDTSTNDTFVVMANGLCGAKAITQEDEGYKAFYEALRTVCLELARMMAGDGEGATRRIEMTVSGMDTLEHARILARSVISSSLTKAAVFGADANFGRILCALGYAGVDFDPNALKLYFENADDPSDRMMIYDDGDPVPFDEEKATALLKKPVVLIHAVFSMGDQEATAFGCDLTYDYVSINADYRS
ncbi:MAG: bifunctional glutamate N-acetyltransferase/amino-acid acetyltransferase ArgJ [Lachnospiraceae bacterium]|nr:bifunctional glutamate N-acetyltransferase/amino-acid acetyltransferase ArgJ [Lachnospiraceae bacterium]